jgi:hypothetical protein
MLVNVKSRRPKSTSSSIIVGSRKLIYDTNLSPGEKVVLAYLKHSGSSVVCRDNMNIVHRMFGRMQNINLRLNFSSIPRIDQSNRICKAEWSLMK